MIKAVMNAGNIFAALDRLVGRSKKASFVAAQAGAEVFYAEVRMRAPVGTAAEHWFYGREAKKAAKGNKRAAAYLIKQGSLRDSIYQHRSRKAEQRGQALYSVAWNHREAPYGYMVENGTSTAPAHPFLRPAFDAARPAAIQAANMALRGVLKE